MAGQMAVASRKLDQVRLCPIGLYSLIPKGVPVSRDEKGAFSVEAPDMYKDGVEQSSASDGNSADTAIP